jgi:hypothetical protein
MRKFTVWSVIFVFFLSGCTFSFEVLTPRAPVTDVQVTVSDIVAISSTPTAVPIAPTLAPPTTNPIFFNGRPATTQNDDRMDLSSFPAGTKIVYVIWDYQNMREGMQIRREWYLNGEPWLVREEPWDFAKYGSTGTMRDVSIHDETAGLDLGTYHFRVYIDNVLQPIGGLFYEPIQEWLAFDIGLPEQESFMGYGSWDGQWGVEVYGGNRVILKNVTNGESRQILIVQEVPYVTWFNDSKHFLFVDRDRSEQKPGTNIGIRDHLWIVDISNGSALRVYKGDTSFAGQWGPVPSQDGKYIASLSGSGYGDACLKDSHMIFFEVASDFQSVKTIKQEDFTGLPAFNESWIYPVAEGHWDNEGIYSVTLDGTCNADKSKLGQFQFNVPNRTATQVSIPNGQSVSGDLGYGMVHGTVTDASGAPIPNATVICGHQSYSSQFYCAGVLTTNADGTFAFTNVFFHDTDAIYVTVQAAGYEETTVSQSFFGTNDWEVNVMLNRVP